MTILMRSNRRFRESAGYVLGLGGVVVCTLLLPLAPWERGLDTSAAPYLATILGATVLGGIAPGVVTAVAAFLFFMDFVFVPAHYTFTLADPVDVIAMFGFLGLAGFVARLLHQSRAEAELATQREQEAQTIAEIIRVLDSTDELVPMLESITIWAVHNLDVKVCVALLPDGEGHLQVAAQSESDAASDSSGPSVPVEAERSLAAGEARWSAAGARQFGHLPIQAGGTVVGVLRIVGPVGLEATVRHQDRVWTALVRQVGLAIERARLREASTEAEIFRRGDELKSALLATVSHELGTPLAVIKAAARTLAGGDVGNDPILERELAEMIHREVDRLRGIVTDLLDVSRIEGGALRLELGWYDMGELIRECVARLRPRLGDRFVEVNASTDLLVEVDYMLIERVVDNLVENAVRHAPEKRPVRIEIQPGTGYVEVTVSDEGPGIPAEDLNRVFQKFHQVEGRSGGVGLGLAICKGIIEEHRGTIWAESPVKEGHGLAVHFTIPWVPVLAPLPA